MLHFIYTGTFSDSCHVDAKSWEELVQLLLVADVYQVLPMISAVASILKRLLDDIELVQKSAFELPEHLHQYGEIASLMKEARASLVHGYKKVSTWDDPDFASLSVEALRFLLQNDDLQSTSEEEVFQQVQEWTRKRFEGSESRQRVMSELCPHLRFAHMSGEFLPERVIYDPDMQSSVSQKHVLEGLLYAASSEIRKGLNTEKRFSERIGVEKPWAFKFTAKARVDTAGMTTWSPAYESRGTNWKIKVTKIVRTDPNTVGVSLVQSSFTRKELAQRQKRLRVELSAKCQKTGKWTTERSFDHIYANTADPDSWGYWDHFGKSWDLVKDDRTLVDAAGDIEVKVKATVELVESPEQESL
jgi:hypothetical protein